MITNDFRATPLLGRMQQVAMTYVTRPLFWWACGFGSILALITMVYFATECEGKGLEDTAIRFPLMTFSGSLALIFSVLLIGHAKWQLVNPAARLVPGYRVPHIGLLASLMFCVLGVFPFLFCLGTKFGISPLGLATLLIAIAGPIFLGFRHTWSFAWLLGFAAFLTAVQPLSAQFWFDPNRVYVPFHLGVLLIGWGCVAIWLRGLASLHEERSDYNIPSICAHYDRASRSERAEQRKLAALAMKSIPILGRLADRTIDQALAEPPSSPRQLLRLGFGATSSEWRAVMNFVGFGGMFFMLPMILGCVLEKNDVETLPKIMRALLTGPVVIACLVPGSFISQMLTVRRPLMEAELLRPITRGKYFAAMIQDGFRDAAIQVVAFVGATLLFTGWFLPEAISFFSVTAFLAAAIGGSFFMTGFNIWCASFRIGMLQFLLPSLSMIPLILGFTGIWWKITKGNPTMLEQTIWSIVALGLASLLPLLGLFFLRTAKRRWMEVELG